MIEKMNVVVVEVSIVHGQKKVKKKKNSSRSVNSNLEVSNWRWNTSTTKTPLERVDGLLKRQVSKLCMPLTLRDSIIVAWS